MTGNFLVVLITRKRDGQPLVRSTRYVTPVIHRKSHPNSIFGQDCQLRAAHATLTQPVVCDQKGRLGVETHHHVLMYYQSHQSRKAGQDDFLDGRDIFG